MLGPSAPSERSRPREAIDDDFGWLSEDDGEVEATCELCRSEALTSLEYGLRVCPPCDDEYLP